MHKVTGVSTMTSDDLQGYLSVAHTLNHSNSTGGYNGETNLTVSRDNAFLLQAYRDQLLAANATTFTFGKIFTAIPRTNLETYARQTLSMPACRARSARATSGTLP